MAATAALKTTGWLDPTDSGEDYAEWTNGANGKTSNNSYATTPNSANVRNDYYTFDVPDLTGKTIVGFQAKLEAKDSIGSIATLTWAWSGDGGAAYGSESSATTALTTSDVEYTLSAESLPSASQLTNGNLRVRIRRNDGFHASSTVSLDAVSIQVLYIQGTNKVYDTFTVGADASLASHNPDTGTASSWAEFLDYGSKDIQTIAATDTARINSTGLSGGSHYSNSTSIGNANYSVIVKLAAVDTSGDDYAYIYGRIQDSDDLYCVEMSGDTSFIALYKQVAGAWTQLGSTYATTYAVGDYIELSFEGTAITVYRNGASIIDTTDSAHSAEGDAGIGIGRNRVATGDADTNWQLDEFYIIVREDIQTASVSPVSVTLTVPAVTATYVQVGTASVSPVSVALTVPAVTATYVQIGTASVSPVVVTLTVPAVTANNVATASVSPVVVTITPAAVTATYQAVISASVSPVVVTLTVPAVTAVNYYAASVAPVVVTITVPEVTAQYSVPYSADVSPVVVTLTVPAVTATYVQVQTASVSPVGVAISVPSVTATYVQVETASVSPASVTITVPAVTASYVQIETASVSPVGVAISVPSVTATYVQVATASASPVVVSISVPAVTATYVYQVTASVSPVEVSISVPAVTATYIFVGTASVSPVEVLISVPSVTATYAAIIQASVSPVSVAISVPAVTATYAAVISASVSPVVVTISVPSVEAQVIMSATVTPVSVTLSVPSVTATYIYIATASVSPVVVTISVPSVSAEWDTPLPSASRTGVLNDATTIIVIASYPSRSNVTAPNKYSRAVHPDWPARTVTPSNPSRVGVTL